jgi:hypothetical protein
MDRSAAGPAGGAARREAATLVAGVAVDVPSAAAFIALNDGTVVQARPSPAALGAIRGRAACRAPDPSPPCSTRCAARHGVGHRACPPRRPGRRRRPVQRALYLQGASSAAATPHARGSSAARRSRAAPQSRLGPARSAAPCAHADPLNSKANPLPAQIGQCVYLGADGFVQEVPPAARAPPTRPGADGARRRVSSVSTRGGTRLVRLVRGRGRGGGQQPWRRR